MSFIYLISAIEKVENEELTDDAVAIYKSRFDDNQSSEFYRHRDNLELKCFTDILGIYFLIIASIACHDLPHHR